MSDTSIEWTQRPGTVGRTWNPTVGCTETSPGCRRCYARVMHGRLTLMGQTKYAEPFHVVKPHPPHLALPLRWKVPSTIFVNSMSDLFHEDLPFEYIAAVFGVMAACPLHKFQVLTKRAERLPEFFARMGRAGGIGPYIRKNGDALRGLFETGSRFTTYRGRVVRSGEDAWAMVLNAAGVQTWPLPSVWLGVSVESRKYLPRLDHLRAVPAAVRFVSFEPLLEDLGDVDLTGIHWGIAGAESGHGARAMNEDWVRSLRDQHAQQGSAFFYKQNAINGRKVKLPVLDGRQHMEYPDVR